MLQRPGNDSHRRSLKGPPSARATVSPQAAVPPAKPDTPHAHGGGPQACRQRQKRHPRNAKYPRHRRGNAQHRGHLQHPEQRPCRAVCHQRTATVSTGHSRHHGQHQRCQAAHGQRVQCSQAQRAHGDSPQRRKARPSHRKPMCSIASSLFLRLCTRPQTQASQTSTPPTANCSVPYISPQTVPAAPAGNPAHSNHAASTCSRAAASINHSTQKGLHAFTMGMALEVKNGIMRCATVTYTTTTNPHRPVNTQTRASAWVPTARLSHSPARLTQPSVQAQAMVRACNWSSDWLFRTRPQNCTVIQTRPTTATASPPSATPTHRFAPASHSNHPTACATRGVRSACTGKGSPPSHLGPAVNKKPEKNSGINPNAITVECTSVGDTA